MLVLIILLTLFACNILHFIEIASIFVFVTNYSCQFLKRKLHLLIIWSIFCAFQIKFSDKVNISVGTFYVLTLRNVTARMVTIISSCGCKKALSGTFQCMKCTLQCDTKGLFAVMRRTDITVNIGVTWDRDHSKIVEWSLRSSRTKWKYVFTPNSLFCEIHSFGSEIVFPRFL